MLIDSYDTPAAQSLLALGRQRHSDRSHAHRLLFTEAAAAAIFIAMAGSLATLGRATRPFSLPALAATVVAYLIAARMRYTVGSAWTAPTQLVFVPMLFILPTPWVPLIVAACSVADRLPPAVHEPRAATRPLARVGDSFYALGPALVLVVFAGQGLTWERWPVYLLAFLAQVTFDAGSGLGRSWSAERIAPSRQLPMLWLYVIDAWLSCIGLLIAAGAAARSGLLLLGLPLVGLQWLLAREHQQRLDYSLALTDEHRIAVELQRGLLPRRLPQITGIELAAHYEAAGRGAQAGGDWYDAFALSGGRIGVVVGDVTGRGIEAASTMGQMRSVTRAFALVDEGAHPPGEVLARLNRYQRALADEKLFTVIYAIVDPHHGTVSWAGAGHPPPLLRAASGETRLLAGGDAMIGLVDLAYEHIEDAVNPGDTLILFSDGLVERRGETLDVGLQRLATAAAGGPTRPSALCQHVLTQLLSATRELHDDVTAMFVRIQTDALPSILTSSARSHANPGANLTS